MKKSPPVDGTSYSFGPFRLHPAEHMLLRGDIPVPLAPKAFDLLTMLVAKHGRLVTRDELMKAVWPDSFVEEINLTVNISLLRKLLGDQPDGRVYIVTVPKRGYRFDAPVLENLPQVTPVSASIASGRIDSSPITPSPIAPSAIASSPIGHVPIAPVPVVSGRKPVPELEPPALSLDRAPDTIAADGPKDRPRAWLRWVAYGFAAIILMASGWFVHRRLDSPPVLRRTENPQAYAAYSEGRLQLRKRTMESVQQSVALFQQAIDADPRYAAAYSGLADAYILAGSYGNSFLEPRVAMPKAKQAAEKALALDGTSAESHTSLAYIKLVYEWDWAGAETEFKRALMLDPSYVTAHHWYSHELMAEGRIPESHEQSEQALTLAPADVLMNEHMAWHHLMARQYDRAIPQALKTIELDPNFVQAHRVLALAYLYTNRAAEACEEFQKGVELSHNDPVARAYLARCYARAHRGSDARSILNTLISDSSERYVSSAEIAGVYAALGDTAKTIDWLDRAWAEHAGALIYLNIDPVYDGMRNDPRFQAIVRRINLAPLVDESP